MHAGGVRASVLAGELVDAGLQGVQARVSQVAAEDHCPGVERHRVGEWPDDHVGNQGSLEEGQDRSAVAARVLHGFVHPVGVLVRRGRLGTERGE